VLKTSIRSLSLLAVLFAAGGATAEEHIVRIVSEYENLRMTFVPKHLTVRSGDTVTWINEAAEEHNVFSYPDGVPKGAEYLKSPIMTKAGEKWSYPFRTAGTYEYHCIPHLPMGMHGQVVVDRPSKAGEFHKPSRAEINDYRAQLEKYFDEDEFKFRPRSGRHKRQKADAGHAAGHGKHH